MASVFLSIGVPIVLFAVCAFLLIKYMPWPEAPFLNRERTKAQIIDIVRLSKDTQRFRFSLGSPKTVLGLPAGKHITVFAPNPESCLANGTWNGENDPDKKRKEIDRRYVPITGNNTPGYFDLVVKVYRPGAVKTPDGQEKKWADGGKMSQYLHSRRVGDFVEMLGPSGCHEYLGRGIMKLPAKTVAARHIGMLAGGSGLTPMLQIISQALRDKSDRCNFYLIYANKTEDDILCRDMLEDLVSISKGRFKLTYTLDSPPPKWSHQKGFITKEMIRMFLPPPNAETIVLTCGPPPMIESCRKSLEALQFNKSMVVAL